MIAEEKLWDINFYNVHEMVDGSFAKKLDSRYSGWLVEDQRYHIIEVHWKPELLGTSLFGIKKYYRPKPQAFIFRANPKGPSKNLEGYNSWQTSDKYIKLKEKIDEHFKERFNGIAE